MRHSALAKRAVPADESEAASPGRTNGAKVATKQTNTAAFCDKKFDRETGPTFAAPELAAGDKLAASTKWRWVNVWATYCKPCIEEMPRLVKWQQKLGVDVQFVSVDADEADMAAFRKLHPDTPPSVRLAKAETQQDAWLTQLGLDAGAPIPVHIFVDSSNRVRCIRAGGVREQDYPMVEALLAGQ